MPYCTNCGRKLGDDFEFCPDCGQRVHPDVSRAPFQNNQFSEDAIICNRCGASMPADALYCLNCGSQFNGTAGAVDFEEIQKSVRKNAKLGSDRRKKWIAMLLCVFLGWAGIHRFYEGKIASGILWLLTFGCFFVGWIFDIFYTALTPSHHLWKYGSM